MKALANKSFYPWLVISFSALFLIYKYILQVSPSVMTSQLMQHFHLDGVGLGNLAAMYFYTYLVFQFFAGPILDRLSPRIITCIAIAVCAVGSLLFASAHSLSAAWIARACIGIGAAFATVSYMKMTTNYFRLEQFAFVGGLLATAAMIGSMGGEAPLAVLIARVGWQHSLFYVGMMGLVLAALFLFLVQDKKAPKSPTEMSVTWNDVLNVLKRKENWLLMFYSGFAFVPLSVFGGLWGNPFLHAAYGFTDTQAATLTSLMFLGLAVGAPLFGYISGIINDRYSLMSFGLWVSIIMLLVVIYIPGLSFFWIGVFLFLFGLGTGAFMLCFAVGRDLNDIALMATVASLINTGEGILGAFSEPLVGKVLDVFWHGRTAHGVALFTVTDYHIALMLLPLYLFLAFIFLSFLQFRHRSFRCRE